MRYYYFLIIVVIQIIGVSMIKVTFNSKEYEFKAKISAVRNLKEMYSETLTTLQKKIDTPDLKVDNNIMEDFALSMVWEFIQPDAQGCKPHTDFKTFCQDVEYPEFNTASVYAFRMLWGLSPLEEIKSPSVSEDKDKKNE
jgi:hypothetical protein